MLTRRDFIGTSLATLAATTLAACGNSGSGSPASSSAAGSSAQAKTLTVAASPSPHAEILSKFAAPKLKEQGIDLQTKEYTDYIIPNQVTTSGEADANYFQHINYLSNYNEENGTDLVGVAAIHYEPFGIYAGKSSDLANIADGAQIAVPNDPTNEGRALLLLQQEGLISLKDPNNLEATPVDIADNPHNLQFVEVEAAALPRQLQDVDFAVINGNYAIEAGFHVKDAVAVESKGGKAVEQYANYIVTTPEKKDDDRIAALVSVLTSDDFKQYLSDTYGQDVLPAF
ncbi:MAG: MetQ/NlpA family ABC transporter substrate-binding protein [Coriobacteriaceae bacterium]|uniref:MetQ/NlpA family ABC transporter substrate-binding protein n=1 Tax=Tractidigestivibacter sp. TaxID=2847320 RepID=UPI002A80A6FD|nr:MetQ/NlpA family ABC transporter substrate-binding protein [Tractidigestivibacter sp.]MCI6844317.1 MetQ/NlpA family ABC transporter substrate-binding protein [Coriobacteriaceae bacterium]MDY4534470.1 MetQ/NlpA family ABC transporter substrate-binding protein [Tractidigestivibacter sp.]MDY5270831.1 MetQ/NlpA family ABC transporter substrate-binding protein [Tractidigestivibacter sp.]